MYFKAGDGSTNINCNDEYQQNQQRVFSNEGDYKLSQLVEDKLSQKANFAKRSKFSKEKIANKTQQKYDPFYKLEKCSLKCLNEYYVDRTKSFQFPTANCLFYLTGDYFPEDN